MDVCVHICITRICTPEGRRIHTRAHQGMLILYVYVDKSSVVPNFLKCTCTTHIRYTYSEGSTMVIINSLFFLF